jgi:hypothetical protein
LESSAVVNVPYYEKLGFKYIKEVHLQRDEKPVSLSIMVREPQTEMQKCGVDVIDFAV